MAFQPVSPTMNQLHGLMAYMNQIQTFQRTTPAASSKHWRIATDVMPRVTAVLGLRAGWPSLVDVVGLDAPGPPGIRRDDASVAATSRPPSPTLSVDLIGLESDVPQHPVTYAPRFAQPTLDRAMTLVQLPSVTEEPVEVVAHQPDTEEPLEVMAPQPGGPRAWLASTQ